ncbi:hypothetical protein BQ8482_220104 [Mesorhizobium delmotii]|uniref:Uncharacterized protein n=1 Tax=Mesorhizobium delmotii TaxID=1631247 RepID=A0A2P9ALA9_9HYPH|nr:hypothetical protein BQ8482_220104 [Mesorhizobium delmotii]
MGDAKAASFFSESAACANARSNWACSLNEGDPVLGRQSAKLAVIDVIGIIMQRLDSFLLTERTRPLHHSLSGQRLGGRADDKLTNRGLLVI